MLQILIIQRLIMKWLPAFFLFIMLLALAAPATAAAGISDSVVQPVRTVIPAVTTPMVTVTPVIIQRTMTLTPVSVTITCTAPALCLAEQDAAARWGQNNYIRDSDTSCGTGAAVSRESPSVLYCFRQKSTIGLARTAPPVPIEIATPVTEETIPNTPNEMTTMKNVQTPVGLKAVTTVGTPVVTMTPPASAKQASIVEMFFGFFASIFGGPQSTGSSPPPSGGDMEPTPSLPGGMKPVTQVTTHKPTQPMDTSITVTSPVAGAEYYPSDIIPVKWNIPQNPSGTVTIKLVSQDGSTQTSWATAYVPNSGEFDWYQQDLAHDCGLPGNPDCFGPSLAEMGITQTIQYQNTIYLAPTRTFLVEVSTDAMDPYPAFYGQSGTFTIKNPSAFFGTTLQQDDYFRIGTGTPQKSLGPVTAGTLPWTGYRHSTYGGTQEIKHELWRTLIKPDLTGLYINDKVKKATLTLHVRTDKGTGEGITEGTLDVKTNQAIAQVWALNGSYTSFAAKSQLPVIASYTIPTTPGSSADAVYDGAEGTITIDLTNAVNQWLTKVSDRSLVIVGPDENEQDSPQFFYSEVEVRSFTIERA
jgi:hypothetical protein